MARGIGADGLKECVRDARKSMRDIFIIVGLEGKSKIVGHAKGSWRMIEGTGLSERTAILMENEGTGLNERAAILMVMRKIQ